MNAALPSTLDRSSTWSFVPRSQIKRIAQSATILNSNQSLPVAPEKFASSWADKLITEKDPSAISAIQENPTELKIQKTAVLSLPSEGSAHWMISVPTNQQCVLDLRWSGASGIANHRLDLFVEENAELFIIIDSLTRSGAYDVDAAQIAHIHLIQHAKSKVQIVYASSQPFGRLDIRSYLEGEGASFDLRVLTQGDRQHQNHIFVDVYHNANQCHSDQIIRSILNGQSLFTCDTTVHIPKNIHESVAHQLVNSLLMSPDAKAVSKPTLLIYNDSVQASHGSTCGSLDPQSLFYLMSRGIPNHEAQAILLRSFAQEVFSGCPQHPALVSLQSRILDQGISA